MDEHANDGSSRSGLVGVILGAVPFGLAAGLVLAALWRWRSGSRGRPAADAAGTPAPAEPHSDEGAVTGNGRQPRIRARIEDLLARARQEDEKPD